MLAAHADSLGGASGIARFNSYRQKGQLHCMKAVAVLAIAYAEGAFDFSFVEVLST